VLDESEPKRIDLAPKKTKLIKHSQKRLAGDTPRAPKPQTSSLKLFLLEKKTKKQQRKKINKLHS
jgi:hypothetical protein